MYYHPAINIDVDKGRFIRKYSDKSIDFVNQKIIEISSDKVLETVYTIMNKHNLNRLDSDVLIKLFTSSKTMSMDSGKSLSDMNDKDIHNFIKKKLDSNNDPDEIVSTNEVYMGLNSKYNEIEDITMAQLIILTSKLSLFSDKLYLVATMQLREFPNAIFYFKPDNGNILLSARSFNRAARAIEYPELDVYIKAMNDLINGKRVIPGVIL